MATIKFRVLSKNTNASIYLRLSMGRGKEVIRKTGFTIDPKDWSKPKAMPHPRNGYLKVLKTDLSNMANRLEMRLNDAAKKGFIIDGEWLENEIDIINNREAPEDLDVLTNYIQHIINTSGQRPNSKGGLGLSERRVKGYYTFKGMIERYEQEARKNKSILIKQVDIKFSEDFKKWLIKKNYSKNYVGKNIDNLKAVCNDADRNGISTSPSLKKIKSFSEAKAPEDIIYLTEEEQERISRVNLQSEALTNARKWLLLGCQLGQRGSDLLRLTKANIKEVKGIRIVELKQQKTGKLTVVPLLPKAEEIIKGGFPYSIALQNFNEYIKLICAKAYIDTPTQGRKKPKSVTTKFEPTVEGIYPKHELIGSHVCRRSFATNYYGRIPTPILMNITGHGTEKMFLKYIGKTAYDNAYQMVDYINKISSSKVVNHK